MCSRPILRQPDYSKQFLLATDASAYSVGAVLLLVNSRGNPGVSAANPYPTPQKPLPLLTSAICQKRFRFQVVFRVFSSFPSFPKLGNSETQKLHNINYRL